MPEQHLRIGLNIGSATIKCVVLDDQDRLVFSCYDRHFSLITQRTRELLARLDHEIVHGSPVSLCISGSAGMGLALGSHIPFVQEVYATKVAADLFLPGTDVIIELGGEDAKILFLRGTLEVRMSGSCAGGTGAFIDQMATLLGITAGEMNEEAKMTLTRLPLPSHRRAEAAAPAIISTCCARRSKRWDLTTFPSSPST